MCWNEMTDEFISGHKHIMYCEAITHPDRRIQYAVPSHNESLINITGKSKSDLMGMIAYYLLRILLKNKLIL